MLFNATYIKENAKYFLLKAKEIGANVGLSANTPIVPVIIGNSQRALETLHFGHPGLLPTTHSFWPHLIPGYSMGFLSHLPLLKILPPL